MIRIKALYHQRLCRFNREPILISILFSENILYIFACSGIFNRNLEFMLIENSRNLFFSCYLNDLINLQSSSISKILLLIFISYSYFKRSCFISCQNNIIRNCSICKFKVTNISGLFDYLILTRDKT